jgi:small-conductance mechanosensitive channel
MASAEANRVQDAFDLYERLISTPWSFTDLRELYDDVPTGILDLTAALALLFVLIDPIYDAWIKRERPWPHGWRGHFAFAVLAVSILLFGYFGSTSFIYFQF